ncbi:uncharacterized protein LOC115727458 [Rhodamnia argentea]|uniref:Uncharacterized protein LOC115727458 n=1 Tax=Rhodamnia argentea TaxID=178133 RepID=A0ABM3HHC8_9MYRT|nr:uncharacterized protein LOC115727458 [Rhodamnia argentea]
MEDWNALAADCIVVSCCCQCLILQIVVFVLLKVPCRLFQKTKQFAKKRFRHSRRKRKSLEMTRHLREGRVVEGAGSSIGVGEDRVFLDVSGRGGRCMEEVEKVLEEMSQKGVFGFGSFWGGENGGSFSGCVCDHQGFDSSVVQFHLIEIVDSSATDIRGSKSIIYA